MDIQLTLSPGDVLIAPPSMKDPRFGKSVILLTKADQHGSQGFVLNKKTHHGVNKILSDETGYRLDVDYPLYWGGPVNPNTVWMLHDASWGLEHTVRINGDWSMTSNKNMFDAMKMGHLPQRFRIFYGFSAWAIDQLENELRGEYPWDHNASWLVLHEPNPDWIATRDKEDLWIDSISFAANQTVSTWL